MTDESAERETLEEKINELTKTLDQLEDQWDIFYNRVDKMTVSKLTDPRHPFTDFELIWLLKKEEQTRFRATMTALQNRLEGKETPAAEQVDIDGVPKEILYAPSKPSLAEVVDTLKKFGRQDDSGFIQWMDALLVEFDEEYGVLARFVLDGVCFSTRKTP